MQKEKGLGGIQCWGKETMMKWIDMIIKKTIDIYDVIFMQIGIN